MIRARDLRATNFFSSFNDVELERLARRAADVHLFAGQWLFREDEPSYFHVLLEGSMSLHKNYLGRSQEMVSFGKYDAPAFTGEVPILMGSRTFISIKADTDCRIARFEARDLHRMIRDSEEFHEFITSAMAERVQRVLHFYTEAAPSRVLIIGSEHDGNCKEIQRFLALSRITYDWIDRDHDCDVIPPDMPSAVKGLAVLVDGIHWLLNAPTVRSVADALGIKTKPPKPHYDVAIVGGGPAGLAAAVYGASEGLSVLLLERDTVGGQAGTSARIENYLGFPDGISGDDMSEKAYRQAERFGADLVLTREVTRLEHMSDGKFCCELDGGDRFSCKTVILAMGVSWRCFDAEGVERLRGRGVLYGAAKSEAASVIGKDVFIVGGGNSAGQAAVFFSNYANSVTVLIRGEALTDSMSTYLIDQISEKSNVRVETSTRIIAVDGSECLESITTVTKNKATRERRADALFILIGATANTSWLPEALLRDDNGFICTGREVVDLACWNGVRQPYMLESSIPGVFCAGDVRHDSMKRVSSSVGEGSMAIAFIHQYLALQPRQ